MADHGRLGWREATFLLEPVAVALAELHGRGLVHRCLTPDSILLTDFLLPRVAGFGMSLPEGERSTSATLVPSLFFSAPELAVPIEADPRADVYSLGAILFAMVTGHVGFVGDAALLIARRATVQARTGKGAAASVLPDALRDLVARAMAEDLRDRPANAAAFVSELRRAVARPHEADTGPAGLQIDVRREPAGETATSASAMALWASAGPGVRSPMASTAGFAVRLAASTARCPLACGVTPARARPRSSLLGRRPTATTTRSAATTTLAPSRSTMTPSSPSPSTRAETSTSTPSSFSRRRIGARTSRSGSPERTATEARARSHFVVGEQAADRSPDRCHGVS